MLSVLKNVKNPRLHNVGYLVVGIVAFEICGGNHTLVIGAVGEGMKNASKKR